jgi:hypothetical protein
MESAKQSHSLQTATGANRVIGLSASGTDTLGMRSKGSQHEAGWA